MDTELQEIPVNSALISLRRQQAIDHFESFVTLMENDRIVEPAQWRLVRFCESAYSSEDAISIVFAPRGSLKTTIMLYFVVWLLIRDRSCRVLISGAVWDQARERLRQIKNLIENKELFNLCFPDLFSFGNLSNESELCVNRPPGSDIKEASIVTSGLSGEKTGSHVNISILDDLVSDLTATKTGTAEVISYFQKMMPLLDAGKSGVPGKILVVGTPWAEDDAYRWIVSALEEGKIPYKYFTETAYTPIDMDILHETEESFAKRGGKLNYPAILPFNKLHMDRVIMGGALFFSQYQMTVLPSEDAMFDVSLIYKISAHMVPRNLVYFLAVDPAGDPTETSAKRKDGDNTAIVVVGVSPSGKIYLVDGVAARLTGTEAMEYIALYSKIYRPRAIGVEKVGLSDFLRNVKLHQRKEGAFSAVEALVPKMESKFSRISSLLPLVETGRVSVVAGNKISDECLHEISRVRRDGTLPKHDDVIDAFAWALTLIDKYFVPDVLADERDSLLTELTAKAGGDKGTLNFWLETRGLVPSRGATPTDWM